MGKIGPPGKVGQLVGYLDTGACEHPVLGLDLRGVCSRSCPRDFLKRYAFGGVYALVDPHDDRAAYVGRSSDIGVRYGQHMMQPSARAASKAAQRNSWIVGLLSQGLSPGLVVISRENQAWIESFWIWHLRKRGLAWLNEAD